MKKWKDNVWNTKNLDELEEFYNEMEKYGDYETMEEIEFYVENGLFWENQEELET